MLPLSGALTTAISPPSRRAISRLIASPRPVPPYLRLVLPSACWNASKMIRCLAGGIPIPVSLTENTTTLGARLSTSLVGSQPSVARPARNVTLPRSVNLKAFESRFRRICWRRFESVCSVSGVRASTSTRKPRPLDSATGRNVRST